jgi:hypothetical protein
LVGKKKAMERKEGKALEKILEKMRIPKNEIAEFKTRVGSENFTRLAELADELVSRERSRAAGAKKVEISPWGTEQISKIIDMLMSMLRIVGPALPVTSKILLPLILGEKGPTLFFVYIEKAVEDVIKEDLEKATKEDIRRWQSKKW